ncbi:AI-2E family transporter [Nodularia spumigena CENA596]|uniref:AI-2E family transporter n=1 Tax=Nodularia spumigena CENA596 TaxID=1819295 RepID=A0A161VKZ3_NODSP|nr:AI-2E family transporter [Nodularia spumigena]KZL49272.1 AI-2E family transporter [Nodularia spumigena CENA596]
MRFGQCISLLAIVISLYILWQIQQILLIVFASIILATVLNQVVQFLQRFRIKRSIAIFLSIGFLVVILVGFSVLIVPPVTQQLRQFSYLMPIALERIRLWNDWLVRVIPDNFLENIQDFRYFTQNLQIWLNRIFNNFVFLLSSSLYIILGTLLFFALTIMFMANASAYKRGFILLFPAFYRQRVAEIINNCADSLIGWIKGTLIAMLFIAVSSYIGLIIFQIPLPLVNALLAGLLEFIPNIGPTLSAIPPIILALADEPWKAGLILLWYVVIQQLDSFVVLPLVMHSQVSLMPAVTLLSIVIFGSFFGFLGVFLAVPLVIVLQVWIQEVLVKDVLNKWDN